VPAIGSLFVKKITKRKKENRRVYPSVFSAIDIDIGIVTV
jgi:hypothetical protein